MTLYELLDRLEKCPSMFLLEPSIVCLKSFLDGWNAVRDGEDDEFYYGFQEWVQNRYRMTSSESWAKIILFNSVNQFEALSEAFRCVNEYRIYRGRIEDHKT